MRLSARLFQDRFATSIYCERYLNDSKGRFEDYSEVSPSYDPQGSSRFVDMPYTHLTRDRYLMVKSDPSRELLEWVETERGCKFLWHPDVSRDELKTNGVVRTQPTSSTRTLLTEDAPRVYIKTDLDKKHFRFVRRLQRSSVEHSIAINRDLREFMGLSCVTKRYGFLPESIGLTVIGGKHEGSGVIFRETEPYPLLTDTHILVPYHSLYATDPFHPEDKPLLVEMVLLHGRNDALGFFVSEIIGPILEAWVMLVTKRGLLPELHGQNALAEIDEDYRILRVVHRDFQSLYYDEEIRQKLELPLFVKHRAGSEEGTSVESQYSIVFDNMIGKYLLTRLVKCYSLYFHESYTKVTSAIRNYHHQLPGWNVARFPRTTYAFASSSAIQRGNEVNLVDTMVTPEFR